MISHVVDHIHLIHIKPPFNFKKLEAQSNSESHIFQDRMPKDTPFILDAFARRSIIHKEYDSFSSSIFPSI